MFSGSNLQKKYFKAKPFKPCLDVKKGNFRIIRFARAQISPYVTCRPLNILFLSKECRHLLCSLNSALIFFRASQTCLNSYPKKGPLGYHLDFGGSSLTAFFLPQKCPKTSFSQAGHLSSCTREVVEVHLNKKLLFPSLDSIFFFGKYWNINLSGW